MISLVAFLILVALAIILVLLKRNSTFLRGRSLFIFYLVFFTLVVAETIILGQTQHWAHWLLWGILIVMGLVLSNKILFFRYKSTIDALINQVASDLLIDTTKTKSGYTLYFKNGDTELRVRHIPIGVTIVSPKKVSNTDKYKLFVKLLKKKSATIIPRVHIKLGG